MMWLTAGLFNTVVDTDIQFFQGIKKLLWVEIGYLLSISNM